VAEGVHRSQLLDVRPQAVKQAGDRDLVRDGHVGAQYVRVPADFVQHLGQVRRRHLARQVDGRDPGRPEAGILKGGRQGVTDRIAEQQHAAVCPSLVRRGRIA